MQCLHPDRHQRYCAIVPKPEHLQYQEQDKQLNIDFEIKNIYQHQGQALMTLAHAKHSPRVMLLEQNRPYRNSVIADMEEHKNR